MAAYKKVLYETEKIKLAQIKSYIDENLEKDLSNPKLAQLFDYSTITLARHFLQLYGTPPGKYVLKQRMQKAHLLLSGLAAPIASVAVMVGYKNRSSFTRVFTQHFGYAPSSSVNEKKLHDIEN